MKYILLTFITTLSLWGSNILSHKIYERADRTDLLLTFDTPFEGRISQKKEPRRTTLLLYGANYTTTIKRQIKSPFLQSFSIVPDISRTSLILDLPLNATFKVSKTVDNYGLRLRFYKDSKSVATTALKESQEATAPSTKKIPDAIPTKQENLVSNRYIIVIAILFIAVILLFVIKKKVENRSSGSWLFKENKGSAENFNIIFQKPIDNINKVVLLEVASRQYLVVIGNGHLLLDVFDRQGPIDEDGFDSILRKNQQELDDYMKLDTTKPASKDPLQIYKEKASLEAYKSQM